MKSKRLVPAALCAYLLFCAALSAFYLRNRSFWLDEFQTIDMCALPPLEMLSDAAAGVQPPLYYLIVQAFTALLGPTELAYRLSGFLPTLLLLVFAAVFLYRQFGAFPAFLFATLACATPYALEHMAEVRMYDWALLFVVVCGCGACRVLRGQRGGWGMLTAAGIATAYTHYFALVSVALLYLTLLAALVLRRRDLRPWFGSVGLCALLYLPWLLSFLRHLHGTTENFVLSASDPLRLTLRQVFGDRLSGWLLLGAMLGIFAAYLYRGLRHGFTAHHRLVVTALVSFAGTAAIGYAASALVRPLWVGRYVYPACGLLWLAFGVAAWELFAAARWHWPVVLLAAFTLYSCGKSYVQRYRDIKACNDGVTDSVSWVVERSQPGDRAVSSAGLLLRPVMLRFYFHDAVEVVDYAADGSWLPDDGHSVFLFTPELGYLQEDAKAAAEAAGYTVAESRGVCLSSDYFTVYYLVPTP